MKNRKLKNALLRDRQEYLKELHAAKDSHLYCLYAALLAGAAAAGIDPETKMHTPKCELCHKRFFLPDCPSDALGQICEPCLCENFP